ncbi:MAG: hypothetical protein LAT83_22885, partial [Kiritimatiellae bacterium]|nr:hypothetical protein [Kiritimatiellia bacterium]
SHGLQGIVGNTRQTARVCLGSRQSLSLHDLARLLCKYLTDSGVPQETDSGHKKKSKIFIFQIDF